MLASKAMMKSKDANHAFSFKVGCFILCRLALPSTLALSDHRG
jgi:hypothetical protein